MDVRYADDMQRHVALVRGRRDFDLDPEAIAGDRRRPARARVIGARPAEVGLLEYGIPALRVAGDEETQHRARGKCRPERHAERAGVRRAHAEGRRATAARQRLPRQRRRQIAPVCRGQLPTHAYPLRLTRFPDAGLGRRFGVGERRQHDGTRRGLAAVVHPGLPRTRRWRFARVARLEPTEAFRKRGGRHRSGQQPPGERRPMTSLHVRRALRPRPGDHECRGGEPRPGPRPRHARSR